MFTIRTALKDIHRRRRDPAAFGVWIGTPFVLGTLITLAFGGIGGNSTPTAEIWVVDEDESAMSGLLVTVLRAGPEFGYPVVAAEVSLPEGRAFIDGGKGSALLIFPSNFGDDLLNERPTSLELVINPTQSVLPKIVEQGLFFSSTPSSTCSRALPSR